MGHHCCSKQKVKRGLWSPEEDERLIKHITNHGHGCWSAVPKLAGLQRCGKSCRLRWINYLRPDLKRGSFTENEERIIIDIHRILGNRWAQIAKHLPGRTDNEVKNFWNSCIKKKLIAKGLDPSTHNLLSSHKTHNNHSTTTSKKATTSSLFSISTSTSHEINIIDAHCFDIKTPFATISPSSVIPNSDENSTISTTNTSTTITTTTTPPTTSSFNFQNPNFVSDFGDKNIHCNIMEFTNQQTQSIPSSSTNISSRFGMYEENVMWAPPMENFQSIRQEEFEQQYQQPMLHEKGVVEKANEQNVDTSLMENASFDFEFMESALMPCGMYCNVSPMDQLTWDC